MSGNMYDLDGWAEIDCAASDAIRDSKRPISSLTDPDGAYSVGVVYTEWADDNERPVLRDYLWTDPDRPCQHYIPTTKAGADLCRAQLNLSEED